MEGSFAISKLSSPGSVTRQASSFAHISTSLAGGIGDLRLLERLTAVPSAYVANITFRHHCAAVPCEAHIEHQLQCWVL